MAAYNSWNGTPMAVHPILTEVTRKEWGNNGIICTDWGALNLLVTAHKAFPTHAEGVAAVIKAGVGQILDTTYKPYIYEALEKKILTEADIDKGQLLCCIKIRIVGCGSIKITILTYWSYGYYSAMDE
jgi:beta-glucosidase